MANLLIQAAVGVALSVGVALIRNALTPDQKVTNEGARLNASNVTFASEGDTISRHWGWNRLGGNIIWATRFKEKKTTTTTEQSGGKGGPSIVTTNTTYTYSVSFAVAFCEGNERVQLGRIWADGEPLDLSNITYRFYQGTETQTADTLIQTIEGAGTVPAYRGICYIVFEDFQLEQFGNRLPQITAEIIKGPKTIAGDELESVVRGVLITPGAGEFVYGTRRYYSDNGGDGNSKSENVHNTRGRANILESLDVLDISGPEVDSCALVVSWFGDDLRVGNCTLRPKVEYTENHNVKPQDWAAGGIASRSSAVLMSLDAQGRPNFGGTPSDVTVREAVIELKRRGKRVMFYPFILMDIPPGNTKTDPYTGAGTQGAFPWRGRITCTPAPGQPGTPDKTATAQTQVDAFVGTCTAAHFGAWNGSTIPYTGPNEWTYRRMVLHYAKLVADIFDAGDIFMIGSEMVGLTGVRDSASTFPFVDALVTLAGDVSAVLGAGRLVSYAADWSEYHSYRPGDGSGDVYFNMDPLWTSADIDFIGIDNYLPMSDWRDTADHLDFLAGFDSIYSRDYLRSNIEGGENYDWFYASDADRSTQTRTTITDGAYGKPWVFRNKDMRNWWLNEHYNRPGGTESASPTSWTPEGKPIYFTEYGCPAVDKGTNQPNVFYDPKSAESQLPYFSTGKSDDLIQRRYIEEMVGYWVDESPTSGVYGGPMVSPANMFAWNWDARPYPYFPALTSVWSDGPNYYRGHWLNGRLPMIPLATLATELAELVRVESGVEMDTDALQGALSIVRGMTIEAISSPREILEMLGKAFHFDAFESEGRIKFALRKYATTVQLSIDDLVVTDDNPGGYSLTRAQETDLPAFAKVSFKNEFNDYQTATVDAVKQTGQSDNTMDTTLPLVIPEAYGREIPYVHIMQAWTARETGTLALPPSKLALDPGDVIAMTIKGRNMEFRIDGFEIGEYRNASVQAFDVSIYDGLEFQVSTPVVPVPPFYGSSIVSYMQLPLITGAEARPWAPRVVAYQNPWPGFVSIYKDDLNGGWTLNTVAEGRGVMGKLVSDFYSGPTDVWDYGNELIVDVYSDDQILGTSELAVLSGANVLAIENADGGWEVLQFVDAELIDVRRYKLTKLLRGQGGTESAMRDPVAAGANFVFLSGSDFYALNVPQSSIFQDIDFRSGPGSVPVDDFRFTTTTVPIDAIGLRPFSPVHLAGTLDAGDWSLTWIRRTRFGGDSWDAAGVPLNEDSERYELEILDGATVVRTVTDLSSPAFTYTAAMQVDDFGGPQSSVTFRVYQMSVIYGRGSPGEGTV